MCSLLGRLLLAAIMPWLIVRVGGQYVSSLSMDITPADMHPYAALIINRNTGPLCTGSLIGKRVILTAASCVVGGSAQPSPDLVFVGMSNMYLDTFRRVGGYETHAVLSTRVHPKFDHNNPQENNLALLVLDHKSIHMPVALPNSSYALPSVAAPVTALGFGGRGSDGYWPQLHEDPLQLMAKQDCQVLQAAYAPSSNTSATQACSVLSHTFRSCAAGNVGAPLVITISGREVQLGTLSAGFSCSTDPTVASPSSPALYAWLPAYADWLQKQLASITW